MPWGWIVAISVFLSSTCPLLAQTTNTIDGVATNADNGGAQFIIGSNTAFNVLIVTNTATVIDTTGIIGLRSTAPSNRVTVTGDGSIWTNTGTLTIGQTGSVNQLTISDGGVVLNAGGRIGLAAGANNNTVTVTGSGSLWTNTGAVTLGSAANSGNQLLINNSGTVFSVGGNIGNAASANNNKVTVTGSGSMWSNTSTLVLGGTGAAVGNQLVISNGAVVFNTSGTIGSAAGANNNIVTVTDNGSVWRNSSSLILGAAAVSGNQLVISNGAFVFSAGGNIGGSLGSGIANVQNNSVTLTGSGSVWSNSGALNIGSAGNNGARNRLIISDGATNYSAGLTMGGFGNNYAGGNSNLVLVTGSNSYWSSTGLLSLEGGRSAPTAVGPAVGNMLIISNAAMVNNNGNAVRFGNGQSWTVGAALIVTGPGSVLSNVGAINLGGSVFSGADTSNRVEIIDGGQVFATSVTMGSLGPSVGNFVTIGSGGLLQANTLTIGSTPNSISNVNGIYQFTVAGPTITPNGAGNIALTDGTISFRNVTNVNVFANVIGTANQLTNIAFAGDNTFRLNNASNTATAAQNYTFDTGRGATNYSSLELVGGGPLWRSANLTIGTNGSFLASNTVGTVAAVVTNIGSIEVKNSQMRWLSNVVVSGKYTSDPSTNTFLADLTVSQSGALVGGPGDLFDFKKSFFINSTNHIGVQLATAAVQFSGGGMHTNAITGMDLGSNTFAYAVAFEQQTNFAYGELHLGSLTDQVCFTCGVLPAPSVTNNALYVGWLDLLGDALLVTNLHVASGINIYYNATDPRNAYLGDVTYSLTDCNFLTGGGLLIPIVPEPSVFALLLTAVAAILCRRRL